MGSGPFLRDPSLVFVASWVMVMLNVDADALSARLLWSRFRLPSRSLIPLISVLVTQGAHIFVILVSRRRYILLRINMMWNPLRSIALSVCLSQVHDRSFKVNTLHCHLVHDAISLEVLQILQLLKQLHNRAHRSCWVCMDSLEALSHEDLVV